jgi:hypothetical protein
LGIDKEGKKSRIRESKINEREEKGDRDKGKEKIF